MIAPAIGVETLTEISPRFSTGRPRRRRPLRQLLLCVDSVAVRGSRGRSAGTAACSFRLRRLPVRRRGGLSDGAKYTEQRRLGEGLRQRKLLPRYSKQEIAPFHVELPSTQRTAPAGRSMSCRLLRPTNLRQRPESPVGGGDVRLPRSATPRGQAGAVSVRKACASVHLPLAATRTDDGLSATRASADGGDENALRPGQWRRRWARQGVLRPARPLLTRRRGGNALEITVGVVRLHPSSTARPPMRASAPSCRRRACRRRRRNWCCCRSRLPCARRRRRDLVKRADDLRQLDSPAPAPIERVGQHRLRRLTRGENSPAMTAEAALGLRVCDYRRILRKPGA